MDAKQWTGDDNRDELTHDTELDSCTDCGAVFNEPCQPDCLCSYCIGKRARGRAVEPEVV